MKKLKFDITMLGSMYRNDLFLKELDCLIICKKNEISK